MYGWRLFIMVEAMVLAAVALLCAPHGFGAEPATRTAAKATHAIHGSRMAAALPVPAQASTPPQTPPTGKNPEPFSNPNLLQQDPPHMTTGAIGATGVSDVGQGDLLTRAPRLGAIGELTPPKPAPTAATAPSAPQLPKPPSISSEADSGCASPDLSVLLSPRCLALMRSARLPSDFGLSGTAPAQEPEQVGCHVVILGADGKTTAPKEFHTHDVRHCIAVATSMSYGIPGSENITADDPRYGVFAVTCTRPPPGKSITCQAQK